MATWCDYSIIVGLIHLLLVNLALYLMIEVFAEALTDTAESNFPSWIKWIFFLCNYTAESFELLGKWHYRTAGLVFASIFWCMWGFERSLCLGTALGITGLFMFLVDRNMD